MTRKKTKGDGKSHAKKHYVALLEKSTQLGMPKAFINDLIVHDKRWCHDENPLGLPFLWVVHEAGTHIWRPGANEENDFKRTGLLREGVMEAMFHGMCETVRFFWWDGSSLSAIGTAEQARVLLVQEYVKNGGKS